MSGLDNVGCNTEKEIDTVDHIQSKTETLLVQSLQLFSTLNWLSQPVAC